MPLTVKAAPPPVPAASTPVAPRLVQQGLQRVYLDGMKLGGRFLTKVSQPWNLRHVAEAAARTGLAQGADPPRNERPIVVVPGLGAGPDRYTNLARTLELSTGRPVYSVKLADNAIHDIPTSARELKRVVDGIARRHPGQEVDVVAHSLGGLIARDYVQNLGGAERVDRMVMIAAPNSGIRLSGFTDAAAGAIGLGAVSQFEQGSSYLAKLNATPLAEGVRYLSISSKKDGMVSPEAARLPAGPNVLNATLDGPWVTTNHVALANPSRKVASLAVQFLERPEAALPQRSSNSRTAS